MRIDPASYGGLDRLGRERLSAHFFMREFLHSEVAVHYGIRNVPSDVELALKTGRALCEILLEPLNAAFGRIVVRSGYRCRALNDVGDANRHDCGSSDGNRARHIWDEADGEGRIGACATILIPWYWERKAEVSWQAMGWWIHDHLPYSDVQFFASRCFNITWSSAPRRRIWAMHGPAPRALPTRDAPAWPGLHKSAYPGFPEL